MQLTANQLKQLHDFQSLVASIDPTKEVPK